MIFWYFCKNYVPRSEGPPLISIPVLFAIGLVPLIFFTKIFECLGVCHYLLNLTPFQTSPYFENTVEKGEIARKEQFLLFPQCFLPVWRTFCQFHQS